ncbi:MAG: DUF4253 domain-containing protein [Pseudomonadota bacterium]
MTVTEDSSSNSWFSRLMKIFGGGAEPENWHQRLPEEGLSESDRFLTEHLPFERVSVAGWAAPERWEKIRRNEAVYPIIVGPDEELIRIAEHFSLMSESVEEILERAAKLQHPASMHELRAKELQMEKEYLASSGITEDETAFQPPEGTWPDERPEAQIGPVIVSNLLDGKFHDRVHILKIPTKLGHEVSAYLRCGGWNDCPDAAYHVAAIRSWEERYGAELVAVSGDVVELKVKNRPESNEEAMTLAREHYAFCSDVVDQGTETIANLAAILMESDWWYFWWD